MLLAKDDLPTNGTPVIEIKMGLVPNEIKQIRQI